MHVIEKFNEIEWLSSKHYPENTSIQSVSKECDKIIQLLEDIVTKAYENGSIEAMEELVYLGNFISNWLHESNDYHDSLSNSTRHFTSIPIPYNHLTDLSAFKKYPIGYSIDGAYRKSKRTNDENAFTRYARLLIEEISSILWIFKHANRLPEENDNQLFRRLYVESKDLHDTHIPGLKPQIEVSTKIHLQSFLLWEDFRGLPPFNETDSDAWRNACLKLFRETFPHWERINELATYINDSDVESEGQMRSKIIFRLGRAINSLARGIK